MKKLSNKKIYFILAFSAIFLPFSVFASNVYIDTDHQEFFVGNTIMFSVRVDSENKNINAIEGNVLMDYEADSISLIDINTSGSKFSLWPGKPLPSANNINVSFAGGSPGGFNSKDAIVFNIVLKLQKVGQIILTPDNIGVYLNDGKGTKDKVNVKNLAIDVLPEKSDSKIINDWSSLISNDKTPPEPFEIYLGQEGSVFDGRKFLSFSTTDEQSGIAYYEVTEGDLPPVRSNDTYILQEQNKPVKVTVVAYDSAGNTRESIYSFTAPNYVVYVVSFVILLFIILLVFIFRKKRKTKNEFTKK
jgi:hypothetical protein